jgi:PilZ domain
MVSTRASEPDQKNWIADPGRRRSMRVLLSVPISVKGKTASGEDFQEETRTLVVNAHGALISLKAPVTPGQELTLSSHATQKTVKCRIVYLGAQQAGKIQMGIEFESPSATFWPIDFPPEDWIVPEN